MQFFIKLKMSRRSLPRASKVAVRHTFFSDSDASSDLSEDDLNLLEMFEAILQENAKTRSNRRGPRKRTPKRPRQSNVAKEQSTSLAKKPKTSQKKSRSKNVASSSTGVVFLDSEEDNIDKAVTENHTKQIENKVDSFFKSNNLVSDDDDGEIIIPKSSVQVAPKQKEFYTLSDSDEEIGKLVKSTADSRDSTIPIEGSSGLKSLSEESVSKTDELMDIVDKILDCDDTTVEIPHTEPDQSWSEYKNKAEEILGNINTLLQEIKEDTKPPEESKVLESSPEKNQPTCPICFEKLGGEVLPMTTICGHIFCKKCITRAVKTSKRCPTCRKNVTIKKIHAVYL